MSGRRLRLLAAFVLVDVIIASVALAVVLSRSGGSASGAGAPPPASQTASDRPSGAASGSASVSPSGGAKLTGPTATMVDWAKSELPKTVTLLADKAAAANLSAAGFSVLGPAEAGGRQIDFVVSTPALRAQASKYRSAADALATSVPVVLAGSGNDVATVRQVASLSSAVMASDARVRRTSENQLLSNPDFHASARAAQLLRVGALDLRCATVLALITSTQRVDLLRINVSSAESAAGRPARSIDVTAASTSKLKQAVTNLSSDYKLAVWQVRSDGSVHLVWPVDAQPVSQP